MFLEDSWAAPLDSTPHVFTLEAKLGMAEAEELAPAGCESSSPALVAWIMSSLCMLVQRYERAMQLWEVNLSGQQYKTSSQ
jgi:hypothetical protein